MSGALDEKAKRINELAGVKPKTKVSRRHKSGYSRWGNEHAIEPRGQITVSKSVVNEFFATFAPEERRTAADFGIRHAIDHQDEIRKQ